MATSFDICELEVSTLIAEIDSGALGLPNMQRSFIWENSKIIKLLDSMMRGYPVGYLMLWDCPTLAKKKPIVVGKRIYDSPKEVIIDGQQRLTSLYAVMKGKKVTNAKYVTDTIVISYNPLENRFKAGDKENKPTDDNKKKGKNRVVDYNYIRNITEIFQTDNILDYVNNFISDLEKRRTLMPNDKKIISNNIMTLFNLPNYKFPIFKIKSEVEEEDVSDIFVRVNNRGTKLTENDFILTLFSLYWNDGREKIENFSKESMEAPKKGEKTSYNHITDVSPQQLIRVIIAYIFNRGRLGYGYKLLRGADFDKRGEINEELRDQRLQKLKEKLDDVLNRNSWHEFLKAIMNAGYLSSDMIIAKNAIFYSYAMYLIAENRFHVPPIANMHLTSLWFFHALLSGLYSSSFETVVEQHLNELDEIHTPEEYKKFILNKVSERMTNDYFNINLTGSEGLAVSGKGNNAWNAYVAALNILKTKVLFSRSNLLVRDLFAPGVDGSRRSLEKHHLFPKAYLKKEKGCKDSEINQMANYAYIDWKDNVKILDGDPKDYYKTACEEMSQKQIEEMEDRNALPHGWESMDYKEEFLPKRRKLMAEKIKEAYEKLKDNVESI